MSVRIRRKIQTHRLIVSEEYRPCVVPDFERTTAHARNLELEVVTRLVIRQVP